MNKNITIGLIVAGVLLLGGAGWFVFGSDSNGGLNKASTEAALNLINPYDQTVTLTITTLDSAEPSNNGTITMRFKDQDTWTMDTSAVEGVAQIIYDGGYSYIQNEQGGTWLRLPAGEATDSPANDFKITDEDIADFRANAVNVGTDDCSLGTCTVYEYTDPSTGEVSKLKISSDNRLANIDTASGTSTINMVFDYDSPVDIQVPTNYQELNIPQ